MEKKPIEAVAPSPRRVAVMPPRQFAPIPGLPAPRQDRRDDIDGEILDWILSHVRNRKPRTSLMSLSLFLTGIGTTFCGAVTSISQPIGLS
jgi:hypothetical protein